MAAENKAYNLLVQKVEQDILDGRLKPADKLPPERDLAQNLGISRNSVREGLRILENIGVVESEQGSGNYISQSFQKPMSDILSLMYCLKGMDRSSVTIFREMIEREAMSLGIDLISAEQKEELKSALSALMAAGNEKDRIEHDRKIHWIIVQSSNNDFLICNYEALMHMIERTIESSRTNIISKMASSIMLDEAHRMMAEGMIEQDIEKALMGLKNHFDYMKSYDVTVS